MAGCCSYRSPTALWGVWNRERWDRVVETGIGLIRSRRCVALYRDHCCEEVANWITGRTTGELLGDLV